MTTTQDVLKQNESQTVWQRLEHPHALYKLIYGCTVVLLISGLVMVASASSIFAYNTYNGNQWALFERQF